MPRIRRSTNAPLAQLNAEINRLIRYDSKNQLDYSGASSQPISKHHLHLNTEALFSKAFRSYEDFIRDVFLLFCQGSSKSKGKKVQSYLKPKNYLHTEEMIKSSMNFLDWTSPDIVIARAELFLKDGYPVKLPYTASRMHLRDMKVIRNHIAHNSVESLDKYKRTVRSHYRGVLPLDIPTPGQFLLLTEPANPSQYKLQFYFDFIKETAQNIV